MQKILAAVLALSLIAPELVLAQTKAVTQPQPAQFSANAAAPQAPSGEQAQTTRPRSKRSQRSYEREVKRRHLGMTKQQWLFLGAVAGTSMGIGALAGGARGLAIGAIVGGWAAYGVHRIWHKIS